MLKVSVAFHFFFSLHSTQEILTLFSAKYWSNRNKAQLMCTVDVEQTILEGIYVTRKILVTQITLPLLDTREIGILEKRGFCCPLPHH